jgi:hypothetical protein
MRDALTGAKQALARYLEPTSQTIFEPVEADRWVVTSLLQKAIRRGEADVAQRAAQTLLTLKGADVWRRFMVIACEDIGAADPPAVVTTISVACDPTFRKRHGETRLAAVLARLLAESTKDRSTDYLGVAPKPSNALTADGGRESIEAIGDGEHSILQQAEAVLRAIGADRGTFDRAGLLNVLARYTELGAPLELIAAVESAAHRTREPITTLVPLVWLGIHAGGQTSTHDCPLPATKVVDAVPMYALDMHTRLGRDAIWCFTRQNSTVRAVLDQHVPAKRHREAAYCAAFYVDAAPVFRQLEWEAAGALKEFGRKRDLLATGVPPEAAEPLVSAMLADIDHLNTLRAEVFLRTRRMARPEATKA